MTSAQPKEARICDFLNKELVEHKRVAKGPLIVGLQGPQGSGKSYTCERIIERLGKQDPPVHAAVLSLDDLYLPHEAMTALGRAHPTYSLLQGRGQPGTHDVQVGERILRAFRADANDTVSLPVYDKSAHGGAGDRQAVWKCVNRPVDVVLFEGWCLGFRSLSETELAQMYEEGKVRFSEMRKEDAKDRAEFTACRLDELRFVNEQLQGWEQVWYPLLDAFVQFVPVAQDGASPWSLIYPWRLEAEHKMKRANGGRGMTDEQVYAFVKRYLPSYQLFSRDMRTPNRWTGHCLVLEIHADRSMGLCRRA